MCLWLRGSVGGGEGLGVCALAWRGAGSGGEVLPEILWMRPAPRLHPRDPISQTTILLPPPTPPLLTLIPPHTYPHTYLPCPLKKTHTAIHPFPRHPPPHPNPHRHTPLSQNPTPQTAPSNPKATHPTYTALDFRYISTAFLHSRTAQCDSSPGNITRIAVCTSRALSVFPFRNFVNSTAC